MSAAILVSDFNPSEVDFNFFKTDKTKKVYVNRSASSRQSIQLQLCEGKPDSALRAPFGISTPMPGAVDNGRKSMEVAVTCPQLGEKLRALDERIKGYLVEDSLQCFGKTVTRELIDEKYTSPYREFNEAGKNNLLRLKVPDECEILGLIAYDEATGTMKCARRSQESIQRGSMIIPSVEITPVWFVSRDTQVGISLTVTNMIVDEREGVAKGPNRTGAAAFRFASGVTMQIEDDAPPGAIDLDEPPAKKQCVEPAEARPTDFL